MKARMSDEEKPRMWVHTVDYRQDRPASLRKALVNRGFWINDLPRLTPLCRLLGHRPVVDGVDFAPMHVGHAQSPRPGRRSRWACCDRCGLRLKQPVDSDLEIGQPYTDPLPSAPAARGTVGGQLIIGPSHDAVSVSVKIGNAGSEHTLAAHLHLHHLGALYLHTERHGTWLQRRLNPTGYQSRVIEISAHDGHLYWQLWAKRDESKRSDPCWMRGSIQLDPRTMIWGPKRYSYTDSGDPVTATVRMPHGDDHEVKLQLQRQSFGRARGGRTKLSWSVDWSARPGIPTKNGDRGVVSASGVAVSDAAVRDGGWVEEACAAVATQMTRDRIRYGYVSEQVGSVAGRAVTAEST